MQRTLALVVAFHGLAGALRAQDEAALRSYFEGRTVVVKVAMPAAEAGIDVTPDASGSPGRVVAEFVEGVLVRFTITSR